jgi:phospholipid-binding lipoprotein MlaA
MRGKTVYGLLLIVGALLAGPAWGNDNVSTSTVSSVAVQVDGKYEGPASEAVTQSATDMGKKDVFAAYDEAAPKVVPTPVTDAPPDNDSQSEAQPVTKENGESEATVAESEATAENGTEDTTIADPIEPINRAMYVFNDKLYFWGLKPIAKGYNFIFPEPVRVSIRDFFRNAAMPVRFVSSVLQGKLRGAGTEIARFSINTTLGLAGFFDVAKNWFKLDPSEEDLGQTLGRYGMGGMMYIVWPFIGPSNIRDTIGLAGDSFLDPLTYVDPFYISLGVRGYEKINSTSLDLRSYEELKESSVEPYTALRDAYIQHRNAMIKK